MTEAFEYFYQAIGRAPAKCGLKVVQHPDFALVIATELEDNLGISITNCAEQLATRVCRDYDIPAGSLVWVEHYFWPREGPTWDLVVFTIDLPNACFVRPEWSRLTEGQVAELRSGKMPDGLRKRMRKGRAWGS